MLPCNLYQLNEICSPLVFVVVDIRLSDRINPFHSSFLIFSHDISNLYTYRLWKLNSLIATAKMNAKSIPNPTMTTATTLGNHDWNQNSLTKSSTVSPVSSMSFLSPNCDATNPYKVQAGGHAHEYHLHQIGMLYCWQGRKINEQGKKISNI